MSPLLVWVIIRNCDWVSFVVVLFVSIIIFWARRSVIMVVAGGRGIRAVMGVSGCPTFATVDRLLMRTRVEGSTVHTHGVRRSAVARVV